VALRCLIVDDNAACVAAARAHAREAVLVVLVSTHGEPDR
jgi:hypothetical protein